MRTRSWTAKKSEIVHNLRNRIADNIEAQKRKVDRKSKVIGKLKKNSGILKFQIAPSNHTEKHNSLVKFIDADSGRLLIVKRKPSQSYYWAILRNLNMKTMKYGAEVKGNPFKRAEAP